MNVDTSPRYNNDIQTGQFGNQRIVIVAGAKETVGIQVVQQMRIQCFNCKEFGHFYKECRKPKRGKRLHLSQGKMLLCKQAEKCVPLQADWLEDTDEEVDEQELEAHYMYMSKFEFSRSFYRLCGHDVAIMILEHAGLDELDFDDLNNNLKVYEHELKVFQIQTLKTLLFWSTEVKGQLLPTVLLTQKNLCSFFAQQASMPKTHDDEGTCCKKKKKLWKKMTNDGNAHDNSKDKKANGHNEKRIVAIEDSNSKALVATDNNEDIDWTKEFDAEPVTYAMMALTGVEQDDWKDLALYDNESWNDPRDFTKPVKEISLPQDVPSTSDHRLIELENQVQHLMEAHLAPKKPIQVNKITSSCEICSGPHDTQYCMKNPEQAFVEYASSRTDEAGCHHRIAGALPSDTVKNLKLNVNSTSPVLSARSYPTEDPQCSTQIHGSINTIKIYKINPLNDKPEEEEQEKKENPEKHKH
ncbi:MAK10-like protein [Tanacetum coccineum]